MAKTGKRYTAARETIDRKKLYGLDEAVKLVKSNATAKFDETVEVAINLGVDPRHADQMVQAGLFGSRFLQKMPRPKRPRKQAPILLALMILLPKYRPVTLILIAALRHRT